MIEYERASTQYYTNSPGSLDRQLKKQAPFTYFDHLTIIEDTCKI